jgi:hypothetical protein
MKKWSPNFPLAPTTHTSHHTELKVSNFEGKLVLSPAAEFDFDFFKPFFVEKTMNK